MKNFKGKLVGTIQYFHRSSLNLLSSETQTLVEVADKVVDGRFNWNVVKLDQKTLDMSLLDYESFEESAFPALLKSCQVNLTQKTFKIRNHSADNPPILHRKELLLPPEHASQSV